MAVDAESDQGKALALVLAVIKNYGFAYRMATVRAIVDGVVGLHARDNILYREALEIVRMNMLRMFYAETSIALAVRLGNIEKYVEQIPYGTVANGVHNDMQAGLVGR